MMLNRGTHQLATHKGSSASSGPLIRRPLTQRHASEKPDLPILTSQSEIDTANPRQGQWAWNLLSGTQAVASQLLSHFSPKWPGPYDAQSTQQEQERAEKVIILKPQNIVVLDNAPAGSACVHAISGHHPVIEVPSITYRYTRQ